MFSSVRFRRSFSDGFTTNDVEYIWKRDKVIVEQPTMAQFAITSSKTSRIVQVYITGKILNRKYSFGEHTFNKH